ncbi:MAG: T9SS type A sorting domain-containing protein [bacterium]|nr:T9SS type A sorting domain-containing protein [bacterium]
MAWGALLAGLLVASAPASARWVQVGFLGEAAPEAVEVTFAGTDHAVPLLAAGNAGRPCRISRPLALPESTGGRLVVRWGTPGLEQHREFVLPEREEIPVQVLLVPADQQREERPPATAVELAPRLFPNPFNANTVLSLSLAVATEARIEVFDLLGRSLTVVQDGPLTAGTHFLFIDGSRWASGTYFLSYRLSPGASGVHRLQLLK